jgi:hypothetical protein
VSKFQKSSDRRKEERLVPTSLVSCGLWLNKKHDATTFLGRFDVSNLSRLGLGISIDGQKIHQKGNESALQVGTTLNGTLEINQNKIEFMAVVRVLTDSFLGIEYSNVSAEFFLQMKKILSPSFVAQSIYPISKEALDATVLAAFRGADFECVVFQNTDTQATRGSAALTSIGKIQFFVNGIVLELTVSNAHVVPRMLTKSFEKGSDSVRLLKSFGQLNESPERKVIQDTLQNILSICAVWQPADKELAAGISHVVTSATQNFH